MICYNTYVISLFKTTEAPSQRRVWLVLLVLAALLASTVFASAHAHALGELGEDCQVCLLGNSTGHGAVATPALAAPEYLEASDAVALSLVSIQDSTHDGLQARAPPAANGQKTR